MLHDWNREAEESAGRRALALVRRLHANKVLERHSPGLTAEMADIIREAGPTAEERKALVEGAPGV